MNAIERLKDKSDRAKVNLWLDHIQEFDKPTRDEVIEHCSKDVSARAYYVAKYDNINAL